MGCVMVMGMRMFAQFVSNLFIHLYFSLAHSAVIRPDPFSVNNVSLSVCLCVCKLKEFVNWMGLVNFAFKIVVIKNEFERRARPSCLLQSKEGREDIVIVEEPQFELAEYFPHFVPLPSPSKVNYSQLKQKLNSLL